MSFDFDPVNFLSQETTTAAEKRPPVPAVDYTATIKDIKADTWKSSTKLNDDGTFKSGPLFLFTLELDLPEDVRERCKIKQLTLVDRVMPDVAQDGRSLDWSVGRNNRLRIYREATGLNSNGAPFSIMMLIGKLVKVRVSHEEYQGSVQERVGAIGKV